MARILALSSQVASGHVGLSAIVPALHAFGHEVIALPTILLSNHPGHCHVAADRIAPSFLVRMLDALDANGWLGSVDAILTGYLPSAEHVHFARDAVARVRARSGRAVYLCDPVIGDEPKGIYIAEDAANAIRDDLVPLADVIKLNRFELDWLTGKVWSSSHLLRMPAPGLGRGTIIATSMTGTSEDEILNIAAHGSLRWSASHTRRTGVPKGTGDLLSGLLLAARMSGDDWPTSLGRATAALHRVIAASIGHDELAITALTAQSRDSLMVHPVLTRDLDAAS